MRFPKYLASVRNETGRVKARGWSDQSQEEADQRAHTRLDRILSALRSRQVDRLDRYVYEVDQVISEEVIDQISNGDKLLAVISRNGYGALIMNAAEMMFVDIDFPRQPVKRSLFAWFQKKSPELPPPETLVLDKCRAWQTHHPTFALRVYRTFAGMRLIIANQRFAEVDDSVVQMMQELGCDDLYIRLCKSQRCFRARLTPKPWRMKMENPPSRSSWNEAEKLAEYESWVREYVSNAARFAACRYLETLGPNDIDPGMVELIELHDRLSGSSSDLPLA